MCAKQADGLPLRVHLEKQASGLFPDLGALGRLEEAPKLPTLAADLWAHYSELHSRRQFNENGPVRFSWSDIQAWLNVTGLRLQPWQLQIISIIENCYFKAEAETRPK